MIRTWTKAALSLAGYKVSRVDAATASRGLSRSMTDVLALASELGVDPATVIDVGVANGTPDLYRAFPEAALVLVEPLAEFADACAAALADRRGVHVNAVAGPADGQTRINVHSEHLEGSSVYREVMGPSADGHSRPVNMLRVDTIIDREGFASPFVLKVDVQGAEVQVLDGSKRTLGGCELVLLEVSLFEFLRGAPQLADVLAYMHDQGFSVFDVFGGLFRPLDGALGQIDLAFARDTGPLRADHRWASILDG